MTKPAESKNVLLDEINIAAKKKAMLEKQIIDLRLLLSRNSSVSEL